METPLVTQTENPVQTDNVDENTQTQTNQQEAANIRISEDSNTPKPNEVKWEGDSRYFQTGKKAGTLKPSAGTSGIDAENSGKPAPLRGLKIDDLKQTVKKTSAPEQTTEETKAKPTKAEKKAVEDSFRS